MDLFCPPLCCVIGVLLLGCGVPPGLAEEGPVDTHSRTVRKAQVRQESARPNIRDYADSELGGETDFDREVASAVNAMHHVDEMFSLLKTRVYRIERAKSRVDADRKYYRGIARAIALGSIQLRVGKGVRPVDCVYVSPGTFLMGHTAEQRSTAAKDAIGSHYDFSVPAHKVRIGVGYFMSKYEISASQFTAYLKASNGDVGKAAAGAGTPQPGDQPACNVTWAEAMQFCQWLGDVNGLQARLPREVEWEYAARGSLYVQRFDDFLEVDTTFGGPWAVDDKRHTVSWCGCVALNSNVQEWCYDDWNETAYQDHIDAMGASDSPANYASSAVRQTSAPPSNLKSVRGASSVDRVQNRDVALRRFKEQTTREPVLGFRIVLPVDYLLAVEGNRSDEH